LATVFGSRVDRRVRFQESWERWPYAVLFAGVALTTLGSSYYHLAPDNARLVWDRLPMTLGFMGLLTSVLTERVSLPVGRRLFAPLLAVGSASVGYWYWSEVQGAGDLRPYLLVQFGSLLVVVLVLVLYPARYPGSRYLFAGLAAYVAARGLEIADATIFALGEIVSGHTLKHLAAAGGVACLILMLRARQRIRSEEMPAAPLRAASRKARAGACALHSLALRRRASVPESPNRRVPRCLHQCLL
jgi:hypothetical protein